MILTNFSAIKQRTRYGPPSFPLTALRDLPQEMQQSVLAILASFPANRFLQTAGLLLAPDADWLPIVL